ncbi:uncharacterized protein LOC111708617 [Eurytemora carolleeae]|uniref:uncharacterized protein LOC111708617 n=1 Tax=Eurytemora carolleeae TaxID=1294199 RepID=UPI000C784103|nr:uncharacterized protein LOC111708617 [Eurytemora carolleeae]|eukprot:XP_023337820.1 uncharacterized protein LOC111708617 [Eurytemora affinis]
MIGVGVNGLTACKPSRGNQFEDGIKLGDDGLLALTSDSNSTISRLSLSWAGYGYLDIPVWLITAGVLLLLLPVVYTIYDKFCKSETINPEGKSLSNTIVVLYLMFGLVWALVGFLWIFGTQNQEECNQESGTYKFAFASLIILNALMDIYICIKISVVLYWALLTEET